MPLQAAISRITTGNAIRYSVTRQGIAVSQAQSIAYVRVNAARQVRLVLRVAESVVSSDTLSADAPLANGLYSWHVDCGTHIRRVQVLGGRIIIDKACLWACSGSR